MKNPEPVETDPKKRADKELVEAALRNMIPSYYLLQKQVEKAADSAWFAFSELERMEKHVHEVHNGAPCPGFECLGDATREDFDEYLATILNAIESENK